MKKVIDTIFCIVIIITVASGFYFVLKHPEDDIFYNAMDNITVFVMLIPILILEIEVRDIIISVFFYKKVKVNLFLNTLSLFVAILLFCSVILCNCVTTNKYEIIPLIILSLYILIKIGWRERNLR